MPDQRSPARRRRGHVVVCGCRGVALRTVEQLHAAGVDVVVVADPADVDPLAERLLSGWEVPRVAGRPREALREAGLAEAAAVVCVPEDDLRAMELALLVRRLRPDVRLVVRQGNEAVARALAEVTGPDSVLDVAALAAPSMVEACLGRRVHALRLAGREFVVAELPVPREATLRELYGDLAPLGVSGFDHVVCPGRDHVVRPGQGVTLVGTREEFAEHDPGGLMAELGPGDGPETGVARVAAGARAAAAERAARRAAEQEAGGRRAGLFALLRALVQDAHPILRATLLGLALLSGVSVVVLRLGYVKESGEHMTWLDAVYFTVETIGTIGYGDFSFAEQESWLRGYAVGLMLFGVVLGAIWFALLTQLLVSGQIERSFRRRRVAALRGHVIVVGLGAIGIRVLPALLAAGKRVVVLERDPANRHLHRARALGVPVVAGDATDAAGLASVNLRHAAAVAILTSDDLVNVETGLVVRDQLGDRWPEVPVVLRLFDRELAETVEDGFAFRNVRSTDALAAPWFVGAALGLDVLGSFYVDRTPFMVGRLRVPPGGGLDGLAMGELSARTRVVAIRRAGGGDDGDGRGELEHPPRKGTRFGAGDDAYLVGPYEELLAVLRRDALTPGSASPGPVSPGPVSPGPVAARPRPPHRA